MARLLVPLLSGVLAVSAVGIASAAGFNDGVCPAATQYVLAVGKLTRDDSPQKVYDTAQAATDAYARCSKDKQSDGASESRHYGDVRAGEFAVIASRALVALGRSDEARTELLRYRALVQQVLDWDAPATQATTADARMPDDEKPSQSPSGGHAQITQGSGATTNGRTKSAYRGPAKDVADRIDAVLAKLPPAAPAQH